MFLIDWLLRALRVVAFIDWLAWGYGGLEGSRKMKQTPPILRPWMAGNAGRKGGALRV